jgi:predicted  nucleic acid-binding Zn-ribbon protein
VEETISHVQQQDTAVQARVDSVEKRLEDTVVKVAADVSVAKTDIEESFITQFDFMQRQLDKLTKKLHDQGQSYEDKLSALTLKHDDMHARLQATDARVEAADAENRSLRGVVEAQADALAAALRDLSARVAAVEASLEDLSTRVVSPLSSLGSRVDSLDDGKVLTGQQIDAMAQEQREQHARVSSAISALQLRILDLTAGNDTTSNSGSGGGGGGNKSILSRGLGGGRGDSAVMHNIQLIITGVTDRLDASENNLIKMQKSLNDQQITVDRQLIATQKSLRSQLDDASTRLQSMQKSTRQQLSRQLSDFERDLLFLVDARQTSSGNNTAVGRGQVRCLACDQSVGDVAGPLSSRRDLLHQLQARAHSHALAVESAALGMSPAQGAAQGTHVVEQLRRADHARIGSAASAASAAVSASASAGEAGVPMADGDGEGYGYGYAGVEAPGTQRLLSVAEGGSTGSGVGAGVGSSGFGLGNDTVTVTTSPAPAPSSPQRSVRSTSPGKIQNENSGFRNSRPSTEPGSSRPLSQPAPSQSQSVTGSPSPMPLGLASSRSLMVVAKGGEVGVEGSDGSVYRGRTNTRVLFAPTGTSTNTKFSLAYTDKLPSHVLPSVSASLAGTGVMMTGAGAAQSATTEMGPFAAVKAGMGALPGTGTLTHSMVDREQRVKPRIRSAGDDVSLSSAYFKTNTTINNNLAGAGVGSGAGGGNGNGSGWSGVQLRAALRKNSSRSRIRKEDAQPGSLGSIASAMGSSLHINRLESQGHRSNASASGLDSGLNDQFSAAGSFSGDADSSPAEGLQADHGGEAGAGGDDVELQGGGPGDEEE